MPELRYDFRGSEIRAELLVSVHVLVNILVRSYFTVGFLVNQKSRLVNQNLVNLNRIRSSG